jgi:hypothetical protein
VRVLRQAGEWPTLPVPEFADLPALIRAEWNLETWLLHDGGLSFGLEGTPRLQALSDFLPDGWAWEVAAVPPLPGAREWQRPGWCSTLKARLEGVLSEHGLSAAGPLKLLSSNDLGTVIEAVAAGGSVYLKVSAHPREVAVTSHLAQHFPDLLPPVLHADAATNTLVTRSGGILLDGVGALRLGRRPFTNWPGFKPPLTPQLWRRWAAPLGPCWIWRST